MTVPPTAILAPSIVQIENGRATNCCVLVPNAMFILNAHTHTALSDVFVMDMAIRLCLYMQYF